MKAGIGCQAKALEFLGVPFCTYRVCEFDKYAIKSYNAIHGTAFETSDITKVNAKDFEIVDTDRFDYLLFYSFPCQDLSLAGHQSGMEKGSGTRSGLLWEVERILKGCVELSKEDKRYGLPNILWMENVPEVVGQKNMSAFADWCEFLRGLGYTNKWEILNAKDYGIPQNRERAYMVSWLGDYYYEFPEPIKLEKRLKDILEDDVDEKYYLSDKAVDGLIAQVESKNINLR